MEREAKFPVPDPGAWQAIAKATRVAGFEQVPLGRERQRNVYFDTETGVLARSRFACRLREVDDRRVVTVKGPAKREKDILLRYEEERLIDADLVAGGMALAEIAWEMLPEEVRSEVGSPAPLIPILESVTVRRNFALEKDGRRVCELALDEVSFEAEGQKLPVYRELELELKGGGTEGEHARLVRWFREEWGLVATERSKLEMGLRFARRQWPPRAS